MNKLYSQITALALIGISFHCKTSFAQWTSNTALNTPICLATGAQRDPRIEDDNNGGAFIVWKDYRASIPDIYVQHVDSNGVIQWTLNGIGACTESADQSTPSMITDGAGGIIITWSDWRSGIERDIFAQRIDANGNLLWAVNGAVVTNKVEREHNERIISDGAGGCIIAWEQQNPSTFQWDIWAQRLNSAGAIMWPSGGVPLTTVTSNKRNPKLQKDNSGGAYITWQDLRNGFEYDIYAQHLNSAGSRTWGTGGLAVCNATNDQNNPKIDPDTINGGVYIAWVDQRNAAGNDIYCQLIDSVGNFIWANNGVVVCNAINNQSAVDILSNSNVDGIILTWKDDRSGNNDIYAQRLNYSGVPQWTANGIPVCSNFYPQINPNISGDGAGGAIIVWQDSTATSQWDIKAQRISTNGNILWTNNGVTVSNAAGTQAGPKNTSDDHGGTIVVWEDFRTGIRDIYIQHIYFDGYQVGIDAPNSFNDLTIYPNPFFNDFQVEFSATSNEIYTLTMQTLLGEDVTSHIQSHIVFENNKMTIAVDATSLQTGVYFLTISSGITQHTIKLLKK